MINMQSIHNRIDALLVKQAIAEFIPNQDMLEEVINAKAKIIAEVALNDSIIRARFNDLLHQQH